MIRLALVWLNVCADSYLAERDNPPASRCFLAFLKYENFSSLELAGAHPETPSPIAGEGWGEGEWEASGRGIDIKSFLRYIANNRTYSLQ